MSCLWYGCVTKVWRLIRRRTLLLLLNVTIAGTCLAVKDAQPSRARLR